MSDPQPRRLAAILAADLVGWTERMAQGEAAALAALRALRAEVIDPAIAAQGGRVVKLMGDGALVEFPSVVDAVRAAARVQRETAARNDALPEQDRLALRIGITLGDVIVDGEDIYGDGVNLAARLEAEAPAGGVAVSRTVVTHAEGKAGVGFRSIGEKALKGVPGKVEVFLLAAEGAAKAPRPRARAPHRARWLALAGAAALVVAAVAVWETLLRPEAVDAGFDREALLAPPEGPRIAVLPFENLSGDPEHAVFADGIAVQILTELSTFDGIDVVSKGSSFRFRDTDDPVSAMQLELGVTYALEGTVLPSTDGIRVTAQLVDSASHSTVWSQSYQRDFTASDLFEVQTEVADAVVLALGDRVSGAIAKVVANKALDKPASSLTSYECLTFLQDDYLRPDVLKRQLECLPALLEAEPRNAFAWARMAALYSFDRTNRYGIFGLSRDELAARIIETAEKAYRLDANNFSAALFHAHAQRLRGDREAFRAALMRAIEIGNDRIGIGWSGGWLAWIGDVELGESIVRNQIAKDPKHYPRTWHWIFAKTAFAEGDFETALSEFRKAYFEGLWWSHLQMAYTLGAMGRTEEAEAEVAALLKVMPGFTLADAVESYEDSLMTPEFMERMVAGLRAAGLPEGGEPASYQPTE